MPLLNGKIKNLGDNTIRDAYVLTQVGQKVEFYPEVIDGLVPSTVNVSNIRYQMTPLLASYTSSTQLTGYEDTIENRVDDCTIFYTKSATHNGIVLGVTSLPNDLTLYELIVNVTAGQKVFVKTVNVLIYNDNAVMHMSSTSTPVQTVLNNLHQTLYGNSLSKYYKSDLLSLTGTLDFSTNSNGISMIRDETGNPLLALTTNINGIDLTGCTSVATSGIMLN
jgi:hypothetical protein